MIKLLVKLFVKNYENKEDKAVRAKVGKLSGIVGILCNVLLCAGKILIGILSGSVSITADAMNNLSDAASSIVTLVGFKLAEQPADEEHPYGHARYEYLSGLAVAAESMCLPSLVLNRLIHSFTRMEPTSTITSGMEKVTDSGWRIFSKEVLASSKPMTSTMAATARPDRYS